MSQPKSGYLFACDSKGACQAAYACAQSDGLCHPLLDAGPGSDDAGAYACADDDGCPSGQVCEQDLCATGSADAGDAGDGGLDESYEEPDGGDGGGLTGPGCNWTGLFGSEMAVTMAPTTSGDLEEVAGLDVAAIAPGTGPALFVGGDVSGALLVFPFQGQGFGAQITLPLPDPGQNGASPDSVVARDFNGDGLIDVAVLDSSYNNVLDVFPGLPDGGLGPVQTFSLYDSSLASSETTIGLAAGDFNKDGYPDLATVETGGAPENILVFYGGSGGLSQNPTTYTTPFMVLGRPTAVDLNNDGYTDLVVPTQTTDYTIALDAVFFGAAGASPATPIVEMSSFSNAPSAVATDAGARVFVNEIADDYDPSGSSCGFGAQNQLFQETVSSSGALVKQTSYLAPDQSGGTLAMGVLAADLNGDGIVDLAIANTQPSFVEESDEGSSVCCENIYAQNQITLLAGMADGGFVQELQLTTVGDRPYWIQPVRLQGSDGGPPDLAISYVSDGCFIGACSGFPTSCGSGEVSVFLNTCH